MVPFHDATDQPAHRSGPAGIVMAVVCTGVVLSSLDLFIVNVALPQIAHGFHGATLASLSWVLNAYAVVFAAFLVPAGRLADRMGRRGGFLVGVAVFTIASAACALATGVGMLVAFRVVQALGAALLVPTSLGLVLAAYPAERRARRGARSGRRRAARSRGGPRGRRAARPGELALGVHRQRADRDRGDRRRPARAAADRGRGRPTPRPHRRSAARGRRRRSYARPRRGEPWGWSLVARRAACSPRPCASLAVFFLRSRSHASPILELSLLRERRYAIAVGATALFSTAFGAMLLSIVLWLQDDWGWSALRAGSRSHRDR